MNLVLFESDELTRPLARNDRRAQHVIGVLHIAAGGMFDAGVVNGARGKAKITALSDRTLTFSFEPIVPPGLPPPRVLIVGLPRPQTARDILRDATTLGVAAIHFVRTEKGDPNYGQSTLWSSGEWRRHVIAGAEQAFVTQIPDVTFGASLGDTLESLRRRPEIGAGVCYALDNYESSQPFAPISPSGLDGKHYVTLAIGAERGWSGRERDLLRAHRFGFVHLGSRVLRTETAVIAALSRCATHCASTG